MTLRAIIFDFDGLILDTEWPIFRAWQLAYERHGHTLTLDEWAHCIGTWGAFDPLADLAERVADLDTDVVVADVDTWHAELLQAEAILPGVLDWLEQARALGLAIGLASSSHAAHISDHLARLGLRHHFSAVRCHGEGLPPKPAPDLYLAACGALGVEPRDALAVEDSPHGIAAAKTAGLRCVAVPNRLTAGLDLSQADVVLESLADLPLASLVTDDTR